MCFRNAKVLLINVHKLDVIFGHAIALRGFEHEIYDIRRVFGLEGQDVFVLSAA